MRIDVINKINEVKGLHEYVMKHSYWYRLLNRNPDYYNNLLKEYKSYKRNENINKFNDTIDNIDTFSQILKIYNG